MVNKAGPTLRKPKIWRASQTLNKSFTLSVTQGEKQGLLAGTEPSLEEQGSVFSASDFQWRLEGCKERVGWRRGRAGRQHCNRQEILRQKGLEWFWKTEKQGERWHWWGGWPNHTGSLRFLSWVFCLLIQRAFNYSTSVHLGEGNGTPLQYSCLENPMDGGAWWAAIHGVAEGPTRLSDFTFTFHFHALEKEMATHSSVLAWRIPGTGEPGGLLSMGWHRVGHDWSDLAAAVAVYI